MPSPSRRARLSRALAFGVLALSLAACATSAAKGWPPSPKGKWGVEPKVSVPAAKPPSHLVKYDLIKGSGASAVPGETVTVQYVGVSYASHQIFDSSWQRHQPFSFVLGGRVIEGWNEGVASMQVGGRRELIIPPGLAYGAESPGQGITANDTLIFIVDLLKIQAPA